MCRQRFNRPESPCSTDERVERRMCALCTTSAVGLQKFSLRCEGSAKGHENPCIDDVHRELGSARTELSDRCTCSGLLPARTPFVMEIGGPILAPTIADSVVATALILWLQHPDRPALQILDQAMQAFESEDLNFAFDDELNPPHPFAELVRRAFAPSLNPAEVFAMIVDLEATSPPSRIRIESTGKEWSLAIERFAERYGIWGPRVC